MFRLIIVLGLLWAPVASADQYIRFIPQSPEGPGETFTAKLSWTQVVIEDVQCDEASGVCIGFIPNIQLAITHTVDGLESDPSNEEEIPINVSQACRADSSGNGVVDLPDLINVKLHLGEGCERLDF